MSNVSESESRGLRESSCGCYLEAFTMMYTKSYSFHTNSKYVGTVSATNLESRHNNKTAVGKHMWLEISTHLARIGLIRSSAEASVTRGCAALAEDALKLVILGK